MVRGTVLPPKPLGQICPRCTSVVNLKLSPDTSTAKAPGLETHFISTG